MTKEMKLTQRRESLSSTDATEVTNTILTITKVREADIISLLLQAGSRMHHNTKTLPIPTTTGKLEFDNFKTYCISLLRKRFAGIN
jgi:hypothetical protein